MKTIKTENLSGHKEEFKQTDLMHACSVIWDCYINAKNPVCKDMLNKTHAIIGALLHGKVEVVETV